MKSVKIAGVLLLVLMVCTLRASIPLALEKAIKQKQVKFSAVGKGQVAGLNQSAHYGKCVEVCLQNLTNKPLTVTLESGLMMIPDDPGVQNMLVTQKSVFALAPNASQKKTVYAMCSEHSDVSPRRGTLFGKLFISDSNLIKMAWFIARHQFQDEDGQSAVWCVAAKNHPSTINCRDCVRTKLLRNFISKLPGIPNAAHAEQTGNSTTRTVDTHKTVFHFGFTLDYRRQVSLILYDAGGNIVSKLIDNRWLDKGSYNSNYNITTETALNGRYFVQLVMDGRELFQRELLMGQAVHSTQEE
jgi:hypothetical protein